MNWRLGLSISCFATFIAGMTIVAEAAHVQGLYKEHCLACHGEGRLGGVGPALLPENLARLRKPEALKVILEGRVATQMLGFADKLKPEEAQQLADWIYTPVLPAPVPIAVVTPIVRACSNCVNWSTSIFCQKALAAGSGLPVAA